MGKTKKTNQTALRTPEAEELVSNIRANLKVKIDIDENNEVGLRLSIDKRYAAEALGDFLERSILNRTISDGGLLKGKGKAERESQSSNAPDMKGLTPREIEVMEQRCEGNTVKEACNLLGMKYNTGKSHLKSIYKKLNVKKDSMAITEFRKLKEQYANSGPFSKSPKINRHSPVFFL